jgi:predicted ester cyclase
MSEDAGRTFYGRYIDCLNARDWGRLGLFVDPEVVHNGRPLGLAGYRAMLEQNVADIPDLRFEVVRLVVALPDLVSRLRFDCRPCGQFLGLPVNGRRVIFHEHAFYRLRDGKIGQVWSILDKDAIKATLRTSP